MELKWRQSTTTFGGPHSLCCKNGLSFSIAYCSLFSLCLFPLLDRERSKRVSKEWQLQKKFILWDTRKRSRQTDTRAGRQMGGWRSEKHVLPNFFCSCCPVMEWVGEMIDSTTEDSTSQPVDSFTGRRAGRKSHSFFTLTPRLNFHLENGILKK